MPEFQPFKTLDRLLEHEEEYKISRKVLCEKESNRTIVLSNLLKNLPSEQFPMADDFEESISTVIIEKLIPHTEKSLPIKETAQDAPALEQVTSTFQEEVQLNAEYYIQQSDEETLSAFESDEHESDPRSDLVYVVEILPESAIVKEEPPLSEEISPVPSVIKTEPLSEQTQSDQDSSFCFEIITKEELILDEEIVPNNSHGSDAHLRFLDAEILNRNGVYRCTECDQYFTHYRSARSHFQSHLQGEGKSLGGVTHREATSPVVEEVPKEQAKEPERILPDSPTVERISVKTELERPMRRSARLGSKRK